MSASPRSLSPYPILCARVCFVSLLDVYSCSYPIKACVCSGPWDDENDNLLADPLLTRGESPKIIIIAVSTAGSVLLILNVILVACYLVRRRKKKCMEEGRIDYCCCILLLYSSFVVALPCSYSFRKLSSLCNYSFLLKSDHNKRNQVKYLIQHIIFIFLLKCLYFHITLAKDHTMAV